MNQRPPITNKSRNIDAMMPRNTCKVCWMCCNTAFKAASVRVIQSVTRVYFSNEVVKAALAPSIRDEASDEG